MTSTPADEPKDTLLGTISAEALTSGDRISQCRLPSGSQIFMSSGCFVCHGQIGSGGAGLSFRSDRVFAQILLGRGIMPSLADKAYDQQVAAVASRIRTSGLRKVTQTREKFGAMDWQVAMGPSQ
jgi:mono/diheme cytochrome c family protein